MHSIIESKGKNEFHKEKAISKKVKFLSMYFSLFSNHQTAETNHIILKLILYIRKKAIILVISTHTIVLRKLIEDCKNINFVLNSQIYFWEIEIISKVISETLLHCFYD